MSETSPKPGQESGHYDLPTFAFVTPPELQTPPLRRRYPIVIIGAGLAGLTLAADLATRGIAAVVLDEDDTVGVRGASSRGIAYGERSLEIMARLGVFDRLIAKGTRWSAGKVLAGDEILYAYDYQPASLSRQPPFLNIQQFYVEWYLVDRIQALALTDLRWKSRVVGARNLGDHVALDVQTPAGNYTIEADWVVDAEGVNSMVRQLLALKEQTERGQDRWCITDVRFTEAPLNERWTWIEAPFNENRGVWKHLMADNVWRLDFQMAPDADPAHVSQPEVARARVQAMLGPDVDFDLVWVGPYSYRTMLMEQFRHGRLLFIGDAAHAKSPFGARGGNSGIADADNLGWKLALVLSGRVGDALLSTYHVERHRAAVENIRVTSRSGRFMQPRSRNEFVLRSAVLQLASRHPFARSLLDAGRLTAPHHYGGLPTVGAGLHDGRSLPNIPLKAGQRDTDLVEVLRGIGEEPLAVLFPEPGQEAKAASLAETLKAEASAKALPLAVRVLGADLSDPRGLLALLTGTPAGGLALIRPDGHLAAALPTASADAAISALRALFGLAKAQDGGDQ